MGTSELPVGDETPDVSELQGRDDAHPAIPVDVIGPVRTQSLPNRSGAVRDLLVDNTSTVKLLGEDLTRARAVVCPTDGDIYLAFTEAEATNGRGLRLAGTELEIRAFGAVYVRAVEAGPVLVVAHSEHWTD